MRLSTFLCSRARGRASTSYLGGLLLLTGLACACDGSGKAGKATPADASSNHGDGDRGDGDGDGQGDGDSGDGDSGDGDSVTGGDGDLDASPGDGDGDTELTDAGSTLDSGLDSGSSSDDAGTTKPDAGDTPGNDDPGQVTCTTLQGSDACDLESEVCCIAQGCVSEATGCENGPELTCDGPEDCSNGDVCCAARSGVGCADSCENGSLETCHDSEDCAENQVCRSVIMGSIGVCVTSGGNGGGSQCMRRADCDQGERCVFGTCVSLPTGDAGIDLPEFDGGFPFP